MGSCNTTKNEKGGKDLLLKICREVEADVAIGSPADPTAVLATAHKAAVGDLVRFKTGTLGTNSDVTAGTIYFVKEVIDVDKFKISATPGGTAISFTSALTDIDIEIFSTIGGLRSKSFAFASEGVDVTNHGSNDWRELLDNAGLKTASISGEGVYTSAPNYRAMEASAFANELVCLAFVEIVTGRVYVGCFKITALEAAGEYNGEGTYSMSAESAAAVSVSQAIA